MLWSWVDTEYSTHRVQHTPSTAYTEYSIHRVQHTPSTAYTEYSICKIVCIPFILMITSWPLNVVSASGVPPYTIDRLQPALHDSTKVKLHCYIPTVASPLTDEKSLSTRRAVHLLSPRTRPYSFDYGLQTCSIMAPRCITKLTQLDPPCSRDHRL